MNERAACVHSWMKNPELLAREFRQFLVHLESYTQSDDHWAHPGSEARRLFVISIEKERLNSPERGSSMNGWSSSNG
jgi:hypothetical protein